MIGDHEKNQKDSDLTILDAASGRGYGVDILKKYFQKAKIIGVELGSKYVRQALEKYAQGQENRSYVQGDVRHLPAADNSVDIVTAFEIIEHLPQADQQTFVNEIARVLKPGHTAYISNPYPYSMVEKTGLAGEKTRKKSGLGTNVHHHYEPTDEEMKQYLKSAGLLIKEEFGQVMVKPELAEKMRKINKIVPLWPMFAWWRRDNMKPQSIPPGQTTLTHIYAVHKPI